MELGNPGAAASLVRKLSFLLEKVRLRFMFTRRIPTHSSTLKFYLLCKDFPTFLNQTRQLCHHYDPYT